MQFGENKQLCPDALKPFVHLLQAALQLALAPLIAFSVGVTFTVVIVLGILAVVLPVTPMVLWLALGLEGSAAARTAPLHHWAKS